MYCEIPQTPNILPVGPASLSRAIPEWMLHREPSSAAAGGAAGSAAAKACSHTRTHSPAAAEPWGSANKCPCPWQRLAC